jgi:hypothetical protein
MIIRDKNLLLLVIGDIVCALIITIIGFITHYGQIEGWRWLASFLPVCIGWLAIAPWLGVYQVSHYLKPAHAWRAALAALLSAPLAAAIRGAWLNTAILPMFVLVLGLTDALGLLLWRSLWPFLARLIRKDG